MVGNDGATPAMPVWCFLYTVGKGMRTRGKAGLLRAKDYSRPGG